MTPAESAVISDMLRSAQADGKALGEETIARMLRAVDGETERLLISWAERGERPWTDHACVDCVPESDFYPLRSKTGWRCLYHRALTLKALACAA